MSASVPAIPVVSEPSNGPQVALHLLIITDQKGSSGARVNELREPTKRHFEAFVEMIAKQTMNVYVIKNIGDSLMVYAAITDPATQVPTLLLHILGTQAQLENNHRNNTPVRVMVLDIGKPDTDFIWGHKIDYQHPNGARGDIIPSTRWVPHWLVGDLFGPSIALAFRAAQVTKDAVVVVDDTVAEHLSNYTNHDVFVSAHVGRTIHVSEPLAFSPFKGLEDLYPLGEPESGGHWRGHLFLRTVSLTGCSGFQNPLLRDQQRNRAFIRLMWSSQLSSQEAEYWVGQLANIDGRAGYIRCFLTVVAEAHYDRDDEVIMPLHNETQCGYILVFAGPNDDTYQHIRKRIDDVPTNSTAFAYPVSMSVYSPPNGQEIQSAFWPVTTASGDWYLLVFARWNDEHRNDDERGFQIALQQIVPTAQWRFRRAGRIVGGECDLYAYFQAESPGALSALSEAFGDWVKQRAQELSRRCVAASDWFLCRVVGKNQPGTQSAADKA